MDSKKVITLVNTIEDALRELQNETGEEYISSTVNGVYFDLGSLLNKNGQRVLSFFREGKK